MKKSSVGFRVYDAKVRAYLRGAGEVREDGRFYMSDDAVDAAVAKTGLDRGLFAGGYKPTGRQRLGGCVWRKGEEPKILTATRKAAAPATPEAALRAKVEAAVATGALTAEAAAPILAKVAAAEAKRAAEAAEKFAADLLAAAEAL